MKFIIEHLENELYKWCMIEYSYISKIVGKNNLIFTKVNNPKDANFLKKFGDVISSSVIDLNLKKSCLLDPKSKIVLNTKDNKLFDYFIFGGILGDYPEQGRTEKYLTSKLKNIKTRNLGDMQMSTDTAVFVTKLILDGKNFNDISFIDKPYIIIKNKKFKEEINLPYRYVLKNNKPMISNDLIKYLKNKKDI